jgi:hypothetical protein
MKFLLKNHKGIYHLEDLFKSNKNIKTEFKNKVVGDGSLIHMAQERDQRFGKEVFWLDRSQGIS